ncbi:MAG TPA: uroporphyrinogen decarboxylase family protein [Chthonomonadaceae bacterium]|nr:uroporphyrinogen decarboxylase family protein [Chthonomonadaceae bacterium]
MNARQRFAATMHYQPRDRSPLMDFGFWDETPVIWQEQGLPPAVNLDAFFGMDPQWIVAPINVHLCPPFPYTVLKDQGDTERVRDEEGVTKERGKFLGSIPRHLDHTLKDRASWEKEFLWRLDGRSPERYPQDWPAYAARYNVPTRDYPLGINAGSLYGWLRNWMGLEAISMLVYDDRALFAEMVETLADCVIASITPALEAGIRFEYALLWEDMCYRAGPLLSPKVFREVLVPNYRRITGLLKRYGVDVVIVDCDGDISQLVPLWLEAGVNTMFPIEVGVWGGDPIAYRQQYGRDLLMIGGVGKRLLAGSYQDITREVERLAPLVEEGGYIPTPDHRVPPDVPLDHYRFYLQEARRVWGKDLPNLKPMGRCRERAQEEITRYAWHLEN